LRVMECKHPFGNTCGPDCRRPLTQEELVALAEGLFDNYGEWEIPNGLKIILVEGNDAT
jgi:hypothetical protein